MTTNEQSIKPFETDRELTDKELQDINGGWQYGLGAKLGNVFINKTIGLIDHWSQLKKPHHPKDWSAKDRQSYLDNMRDRFRGVR